MRTRVVTPPEPIVTYEQAVARLRLDVDAEDEQPGVEQADVEAMIAAATANIDGPMGWLGRCLGPQTIEVDFDTFDDLVSDLPFGPVVSIQAMSYLDTTGARQDLDLTTLEMLGDRLVPAIGTMWPAAYFALDGRQVVRVRYVAGYVTDPSVDPLVPAVPPPILTAILLMVGDLYENRSTTLDARANAAVPVPMSTTVENLLGPFRKWG